MTGIDAPETSTTSAACWLSAVPLLQVDSGSIKSLACDSKPEDSRTSSGTLPESSSSPPEDRPQWSFKNFAQQITFCFIVNR